MPQSLADAHY